MDDYTDPTDPTKPKTAAEALAALRAGKQQQGPRGDPRAALAALRAKKGTPPPSAAAQPSQEDEEHPGYIESAISGMARGITSDFNDEAIGKLTSTFGKDQDYKTVRDAVRAHDAAAERDNPKTVHAAQLVGGLVPAVYGGIMSKGAGLLHAMLGGAVYGAAEGAGAAKEKEDIPSGMAWGGGVGAAGGAVLHGAGQLVSKIGKATGATDYLAGKAADIAEHAPNWISSPLETLKASVGNRGAANKKINQGLANEGATPEQVLDRVRANMASSGEKPEMGGDYSPELKKITAGVSKRPGPGRAKINAAITARGQNTRGRVLQDFTRGGEAVAGDVEAAAAPGLPTQPPPAPTRPAMPADPRPGGKQRIIDAFGDATHYDQNDARAMAEREVRDRAASASEMFGAAHDSEATLDTPEAHELFKRPVMRTLWERAQRAAQNRGEELPTRPSGAISDEMERYISTNIKPEEQEIVRQAFIKDPRNQSTVPIPNVRSLHYMDIALREAEKGFEGSNGITKSDAAAARDILNTHFRPMIADVAPELPAAQADYAARSRSVDAFDEGFKFLKTLSGSRTPKGARGAGDPVALKNFRTGISGLESAMQNMGPEDVARFRSGAQHAVADALQNAPEGEAGSASPMLKGMLKDTPLAQRWQRLLFESPEDFRQFRAAVQTERQGAVGFRAARNQYRTDVEGFRTATKAHNAESSLIGRSNAGNEEAQATLAARLPGGGRPTLRRLGQSRKIADINSVAALKNGSTENVVGRGGPFPNSPHDETVLRQLFPDEASFHRFQSALERERTMASTNDIAGGSQTTELLNEGGAGEHNLLNALAHPVRGLRSLFASGDEIANKKTAAALGERLGTTGTSALENVFREAILARLGQGTLGRGGNAFRNALIPQLPFVGGDQ
jgi:hypothetical protein